MKKSLYKHTKYLMKQAFPKYKRIQAGATLKEISIQSKRRVGRSIGVQTYYHYEYYEERIPMVKFTDVYLKFYSVKHDIHSIYVAVDQHNKTVYWNYEMIGK
jgi:hypothetical protein